MRFGSRQGRYVIGGAVTAAIDAVSTSGAGWSIPPLSRAEMYGTNPFSLSVVGSGSVVGSTSGEAVDKAEIAAGRVEIG